MKKSLFILLLLLSIFPCSLFAQPFKEVNLGSLKEGDVKLIYGETILNTYKAYDTNYVLVSDLKFLGCNVQYLEAEKTVTITAPTQSSVAYSAERSHLLSSPIKMYNGTILLDHFQTRGIICNDNTLIPLAALGSFGVLSIVDSDCYFSPTTSPSVTATQTAVSNFTDSEVNVSVLDIYWDNEPIFISSTYTVQPQAVLTRPTNEEEKIKNSLYVASIVQNAQGLGYTYSSSSYFGQLDASLLKAYVKETTKPVMIDTYGDAIEENKIAEVEAFINSKNLSSPTKYLVWTNISEQRTYIFTGSKNNWSLYKAFICSTGKTSTPTPTGTYALTYKVPSFGQNKGYCCKYAFGFIGTTYLYHSIIFDKTGTYLLENKGVLGKKASDGCIRFSEQDAKWFYDNMLTKTTVYIS